MGGRQRPTIKTVAARAGVGRTTVSRVINGSELVSDEGQGRRARRHRRAELRTELGRPGTGDEQDELRGPGDSRVGEQTGQRALLLGGHPRGQHRPRGDPDTAPAGARTRPGRAGPAHRVGGGAARRRSAPGLGARARPVAGPVGGHGAAHGARRPPLPRRVAQPRALRQRGRSRCGRQASARTRDGGPSPRSAVPSTWTWRAAGSRAGGRPSRRRGTRSRTSWWPRPTSPRRAARPPCVHSLDDVPGLDAVFVASDVMAAGALAELRRQRRSVPDDVAVVGFDDSILARHSNPPLTSVRQPVEEIGSTIARILLKEIGDPEAAASARRSSHRTRGARIVMSSRGSTRS